MALIRFTQRTLGFYRDDQGGSRIAEAPRGTGRQRPGSPHARLGLWRPLGSGRVPAAREPGAAAMGACCSRSPCRTRGAPAAREAILAGARLRGARPGPRPRVVPAPRRDGRRGGPRAGRRALPGGPARRGPQREAHGSRPRPARLSARTRAPVRRFIPRPIRPPRVALDPACGGRPGPLQQPGWTAGPHPRPATGGSPTREGHPDQATSPSSARAAS